jgi:hypothetical protein
MKLTHFIFHLFKRDEWTNESLLWPLFILHIATYIKGDYCTSQSSQGTCSKGGFFFSSSALSSSVRPLINYSLLYSYNTTQPFSQHYHNALTLEKRGCYKILKETGTFHMVKPFPLRYPLLSLSINVKIRHYLKEL